MLTIIILIPPYWRQKDAVIRNPQKLPIAPPALLENEFYSEK